MTPSGWTKVSVVVGTCVGTSVALGVGLDAVVGLIVGTVTLFVLGVRLVSNSVVPDGIGDGGRVGVFGNVEVDSLGIVGSLDRASTDFSNSWSGFNSTLEHPRAASNKMTPMKPVRMMTLEEFRIMPSKLMLRAIRALKNPLCLRSFSLASNQ